METAATTDVLASGLADLLKISETEGRTQHQCGREIDAEKDRHVEAELGLLEVTAVQLRSAP